MDVFVTYMLLLPALLFWIELSIGGFRRFLWWLIAVVFSVGVVGLGYFVVGGSPDKVLRLNNFLAIILLLAGGVVAAVPKLSRKFLVIQSPVLAFTVPAPGAVALYYNASGFHGLEASRNVEPAGYVVWVFALGYVAAERVFGNERRLMSIESELETARQIQFSILPESVPAMAKLRIAASYQPMSAVAGDLYQFIQLDEHRLGVLVADVCGHGVPAALISSMIKAMQSVAECGGPGAGAGRTEPDSVTRIARAADFGGVPVDRFGTWLCAVLGGRTSSAVVLARRAGHTATHRKQRIAVRSIGADGVSGLEFHTSSERPPLALHRRSDRTRERRRGIVRRSPTERSRQRRENASGLRAIAYAALGATSLAAHFGEPAG